MATLSQYIKNKLKKFNIEVDDDELGVLITEQGETPASIFSVSNINIAKKVISSCILDLLVSPDVTQGDFSIKYDRAAISRYYGMLCNELNIPNELEEKPPVVRNSSNRW